MALNLKFTSGFHRCFDALETVFMSRLGHVDDAAENLILQPIECPFSDVRAREDPKGFNTIKVFATSIKVVPMHIAGSKVLDFLELAREALAVRVEQLSYVTGFVSPNGGRWWGGRWAIWETA